MTCARNQFKVNTQSVPKMSGNKRTDRQTDRGDCITSHANAISNDYIDGVMAAPAATESAESSNKDEEDASSKPATSAAVYAQPG